MSIFFRLKWPNRFAIILLGLQVSIYLADYELMVLITLLTGVWELTLFHAVILTNIQSGVRDMLLLPTAYIADSFLGKSWTLVHSSFSYFVVSHYYSHILRSYICPNFNAILWQLTLQENRVKSQKYTWKWAYLQQYKIINASHKHKIK